MTYLTERQCYQLLQRLEAVLPRKDLDDLRSMVGELMQAREREANVRYLHGLEGA